MAQAAATIEGSLADTYRDEIEHLIGEDLVQDALDKLQDFIRDLAPGLKNEALILRRDFANFSREFRRGLAKREDVNLVINRVLDLTGEVHQQAETPKRFHLGAEGLHPGSESRTPSRPVLSLIGEPPRAAPAAPPASPRQAPPVAATVTPFPAGEDRLPQAFTNLDELRKVFWRQFRESRPPRDTVMFSARDITRRYAKGQFRLDELSFQLRAGEITGVVGRNASGKTTLLRMVLGDLRPNSGATEYPMLTRSGSSWTHIKRQIAYVPQFPDRWYGLLRENLNFIAAVHGSRGGANRDLVDWHVARYGLADYEDATWDSISGGYKIRFELVRALLSKPKLVVLDEPLAYLDVIARQEFLKNLQTIATSLEEPVSIIITSQHLYEIEAVADNMIILDDGRVLYTGPLAELVREVSSCMLELSIRAPQRLVQEVLAPLGLTAIESTMDGYVVALPKGTDVGSVVQTLYAKFGNRLMAFRDISGSARSLFKEKAADTLPKRSA